MNAILYLDHIFRGIITGFLIAYLIILGLRPAVMYPDNILEIIDNPWIFLVLIILNYYIFWWDDTIGLLMFLTLIALLMDIILFTEGGFFHENVEIFSQDTASQAQVPTVQQQSYKDINNMILGKLKEIKALHEQNNALIAPYI